MSEPISPWANSKQFTNQHHCKKYALKSTRLKVSFCNYEWLINFNNYNNNNNN